MAARRPPVAQRAPAWQPPRRWQAMRSPPPWSEGLAAAKHRQREEQRHALQHEWRQRGREQARRSAPVRAGARVGTGPPTAASPAVPTAGMRGRPHGPMSRGELYHWHRANGTLELFFALFPH